MEVYFIMKNTKREIHDFVKQNPNYTVVLTQNHIFDTNLSCFGLVRFSDFTFKALAGLVVHQFSSASTQSVAEIFFKMMKFESSVLLKCNHINIDNINFENKLLYTPDDFFDVVDFFNDSKSDRVGFNYIPNAPRYTLNNYDIAGVFDEETYVEPPRMLRESHKNRKMIDLLFDPTELFLDEIKKDKKETN
ncbi:hypothetical protein [Carp edema virus]|nr:hypothetical protein [Carp edema virus]